MTRWAVGKQKTLQGLLLVGLLALIVLLAMGCGPELLTSKWLAGSSKAQGEPDWSKLSAYQIGTIRTTVTLANDSGAFYLRIFSQNRRLTRSLRRAGMTLWLANPNDEKDRLGIHYPIGMQPREPGSRPERMLPGGEMPPDMAGEFLRHNEDVELISKDSTFNGVKTLAQAEELGIRAQLAEADSTAEYTLRVRFAQLPAWFKAGSKVLLKMESAAFVKMEERREEGREGGEHRGWGRRGGGGGGGGGMPPGGGGDEPPMGGGRGRGRGERPGGDERGPGMMRPEKVQTFQFLVELAGGPPA
jgi:hypothetical protein